MDDLIVYFQKIGPVAFLFIAAIYILLRSEIIIKFPRSKNEGGKES